MNRENTSLTIERPKEHAEVEYGSVDAEDGANDIGAIAVNVAVVRNLRREDKTGVRWRALGGSSRGSTTVLLPSQRW